MIQPFSEINAYILQRLKDPDCYTETQFSYLKIYQHALRYAYNKDSSKLIRNYFRLPYKLQEVIYWLKSVRQKNTVQPPTLKEYVLLDHGRGVRDWDNNWHSIYFDKIVNLIGRNKVSMLYLTHATQVAYDYNLDKLHLRLPSLDKHEKALLREINGNLRKARKSNLFTSEELRHLEAQMHLFFDSYRFHYHLFRNQSIKHLILVCHYGREGLLATLRQLKIEHTEIQHGLISRNDIYYVYPTTYSTAISKSLIPDRIIVYGRYWKQLLEEGCEFQSRNIFVGGDHLYRLDDKAKPKYEKENLILVCTQTFMTDDYVPYLRILANHMLQYPEWKVIIKLHPAQTDKQRFDEFLSLGMEVLDKQTPLDILLQRAKIQITIYSTTIFDGLGMDVLNFSLQSFGNMQDYAREMIAEKAALPLLATENPVTKYLQMLDENQTVDNLLLSRDEVYAPFKPEVYQDLLGLPSTQ